MTKDKKPTKTSDEPSGTEPAEDDPEQLRELMAWFRPAEPDADTESAASPASEESPKPHIPADARSAAASPEPAAASPEPATAELDEDDPELLGQLMAWFGGAGHEEVVAAHAKAQEEMDPALRGTSHEPGISDETRAHREHVEQTLATVDLTLITALETQCEQQAVMVTAPMPPAAVIDTSIATFDAQGMDEPRHGVGKRLASDDIADALSVCTPQALLRDLHRMVETVPDVQMTDLPLGVPKMAGPSTHVTDVMGELYTVYLDQEPNSRKYMAEDSADRTTRILLEDWQPPDLSDKEQHEWTSSPSRDAMLWFAGIDPSSLK